MLSTVFDTALCVLIVVQHLRAFVMTRISLVKRIRRTAHHAGVVKYFVTSKQDEMGQQAEQNLHQEQWGSLDSRLSLALIQQPAGFITRSRLRRDIWFA